jgi:chitodextrinase
VIANVPSAANAGEAFALSAQADASGVASIGYAWDFGDGITAEGARVSHTYTRQGTFTVQLTVPGIDGAVATQTFPIKVTGDLHAFPNLLDNRRFRDPADH